MLDLAGGSRAPWVIGNHDVPRPVTRYALGTGYLPDSFAPPGPIGPDALRAGARRARAAALLQLALPGSAYIYQGEELGLPEVADIPDEARQDPTFRRTGGRILGRDGCRVPLPWSGRLGSGVGSIRPWLMSRKTPSELTPTTGRLPSRRGPKARA